MRKGQRVRLKSNPAMKGKLERVSYKQADVLWDDGRVTNVFLSSLEAA